MSKVKGVLFLLLFAGFVFVLSCADNEPTGPNVTDTTSQPQDTVPDSQEPGEDTLTGGEQGDSIQPDTNQTDPDVGGGFVLTVNVQGQGTVSRNPNLSSYATGAVVELTASPSAGWAFSNWEIGGAAGEVQNPTTVVITANMTLTARFTQISVSDPGQVPDTNGTTDPDTVGTTDPGVTIPPVTSRLENITRPCDPSIMPPDVTSENRAWGSRYWDCCKPHCSWPDNTNYLARNCDINNVEMPCYIDRGTWREGTRSGCDTDGVAFTCYSHVPFAVCENLAFGFAAVPAAGNVCGRCYKLQFDGGFQHGTPNDSHEAIRGKIMIVMASNIGHDVAGGQFDIMIPGGGLGAFAAGCAVQWNVDPANSALVGERFGGFARTCEIDLSTRMGWGNFTGEDIKECVRGMCNTLFGNDESKRDLWEGCIWFVDWMHAANNPTFRYEEVECPQILRDLYGSTFHQ